MEQEIEEKIIFDYKNGDSCAKIGKKYNCNPGTVSRLLKKYNISARTKGGISKLPEEKIVDLYFNQRLSSMIIAKQFNVSWKTIQNILHKHNIPIINNKDNYKNLNLNTNYFEDIKTPAQAYFLGWLITDGYANSKRKSISLELQERDIEILELLKKELNSNTKLGFREKKNPSGSSTRTFRLAITSYKMRDDLAKFGVVPKKTGKEFLPKLDDTLMPHLIRGLIDGDGWISSKSKQIGFCGNQNIVTQLRDYLTLKLNIFHVKVVQIEPKLWQVTWASKKDIAIIGNYLYKEKGDFYLKRKFNNFMEIPR